MQALNMTPTDQVRADLALRMSPFPAVETQLIRMSRETFIAEAVRHGFSEQQAKEMAEIEFGGKQ